VLDGSIAKRDEEIKKYCQKLFTNGQGASQSIPEASTPSLNHRLLEFLNGPSRVLLLQAPEGAGKSILSKYLAAIAWHQKHWIPVFVALDFTRSSPLHDHLVEEALIIHGLDSPTITQAREMHRFFIVVEGFDLCHVQTNMYVRHKLQSWPGKAVFTCRTAYLARCPYAFFYFMPETEKHRADPSGLTVITLNSHADKTSAIDEPASATPGEPISIFTILSDFIYYYSNFPNFT
jgi:hypothetical protein